MGSSPEANPELRARVHQQETVAALGQRALEADDVDQLMDDASAAVVDTLETDFCAVLELLPDRDEAFLRHGVGWRDDLVGNEAVPTDLDSQLGSTLHRERPTTVDDLRADERFSGPELLTSHDVTSGVSAIVGSPDDPWGVLGTYATEQREFTEHDANFVQSVANVLASAIENERTQSELEEIYGRISDAFFALDKEWQFTYINERAHELINPEGRTLVGKSVWEEFPEAISRKFKSKYEHAMYEQETVSFEEYYPEPLDSWFEVRAYPSETGLSVYFRDVTERKERERELKRYQTIVETVNDGVYTVDANGRFTMVNETYAEMTGYDREELIGADVSLVVDDEIVDFAQARERELLEGDRERQIIEAELQTADGGTVPTEATFALLFTDGEEYERAAVVRDVTEQKARERKLEEAVEELEESNERLESFASMLAHELRNPVTIGQIYTQQLPVETDSGDGTPDAVEYVTEAFDRIEDMIDVMLVLTRGREAVGGDSTVELAKVAREAWEEVDTPRANVEMEIDRAIQADETYVRHLFRNLFENAVEHGGPDVTVSVGELPTGFYVADDGRGIPDDEQDAVFEAGYTTASDRGGTGLGLAFVEELANVYEWSCSVTESADGGARFEFTDIDTECN